MRDGFIFVILLILCLGMCGRGCEEADAAPVEVAS